MDVDERPLLDELPDAEPFAPADALERFTVQRRVFDAQLELA